MVKTEDSLASQHCGSQVKLDLQVELGHVAQGQVATRGRRSRSVANTSTTIELRVANRLQEHPNERLHYFTRRERKRSSY